MRCCETCGAELVRHRKHSRKQWHEKRFCDRVCASQRLLQPRSCACGCDERPLRGCKYVKGHRTLKLTSQGYRRVWRPGHALADKYGMVLEHRAVLHDAGVTIRPGDHVHHRNGDKADNRRANLEVLRAGDHARHHLSQNGYVVNQFGRWPLRVTAGA